MRHIGSGAVARAAVILTEKKTDDRGNLREIVVWKVEPSPSQPDGIRYRLAFIRRGESTPAILYDNHHPKGHHRHVEGAEEVYEFQNLERLLADFIADVRRASGESE